MANLYRTRAERQARSVAKPVAKTQPRVASRLPASVAARCSCRPGAAPELDEQAALGLQRCVGNAALQRVLALQRNIEVGAADDPLELEADRVAHDVVAMPQPQREVDRDEMPAISRAPEPALDEQDISLVASDDFEQRMADTKSSGQPLPADVRGYMEQRFGRAFDAVRVHTDARAARLARDIDAAAFTYGRDIYYGAGRSPQDHLLTAHELTHVVQQGGAARRAPIRRRIGDGHDLQALRFAGNVVLEACFDNERVLKSGDRGDAVRVLQQALIDAGHPLPRFGVDGIFGAETKTAVRDFQTTAGIGIDGVVGPQTMGALDARFIGPAPTPPAPTPPAPTPPAPTPPAPAPATITSQTVETTPGVRTRTTIGVGERVDLTQSGGATWATSAGQLTDVGGPTLTNPSAATVRLTAPDTAQTVTVTAGTATLAFTVVAPTSVSMDRQPGTGVKHTKDQPDSGVQTRVFLGPDTVNFSRARYRELDVAAVASPGVYSCNPGSGGHCGVGAGSPCPDKALTNTVTAGMGTLSVLGDCAYSGHCGTAPPFAAGTLTISIPYEYKVGTGAFHNFSTVVQTHALAADLVTLTSSKAGATGSTTVAAATTVIVQCP